MKVSKGASKEKKMSEDKKKSGKTVLKSIQDEIRILRKMIEKNTEKVEGIEESLQILLPQITEISSKIDYIGICNSTEEKRRKKSGSTKGKQNIRTYFISQFSENPSKFYEIISEEEINSVYAEFQDDIKKKKNQKSGKALIVYRELIQKNKDRSNELRSMKQAEFEEIDEVLTKHNI